MIELIFNADDFGYSKGINLGIVEAFQSGVVKSTTMMMNMPGTEHAVELAKLHKDLGVGVHLVLTCGKPLSKPEDIPSIVTKEGRFYKNPEELFNRNVKIEDIEKEWRTQIEKFYSFGLIPTHLDSHHHSHTYEPVHELIEKLAIEYQLPVRTFPELKRAKAFSDGICLDFFGEGASVETINHVIEQAKDGQRIEIMTHPGYIDTEIINGSSYWKERASELEILTTWDTPENIILYNKNK